MDKYIPLTNGAQAKVSEEDYEMVSRFQWRLTSGGYASRRDLESDRIIYLHRQINQTPIGMHTDHINRDRLDCTRENLRTASVKQNSHNRGKPRGQFSSRFKGVSIRPSRSQSDDRPPIWQAYIKSDGKKSSLGHYETEFDAAMAYNYEAVKRWGEFAQLNVLPLDFVRARNGVPKRFVGRKYSQFRGVTWSKAAKKFLSNCGTGNNQVRSLHLTEQAAALAYNEVAKSLYGDKARLNVIT